VKKWFTFLKLAFKQTFFEKSVFLSPEIPFLQIIQSLIREKRDILLLILAGFLSGLLFGGIFNPWKIFIKLLLFTPWLFLFGISYILIVYYPDVFMVPHSCNLRSGIEELPPRAILRSGKKSVIIPLSEIKKIKIISEEHPALPFPFNRFAKKSNVLIMFNNGQSFYIPFVKERTVQKLKKFLNRLENRTGIFIKIEEITILDVPLS